MASISPSIHQVSMSSFFHHFSVFVVFTGLLEVQTFCRCPFLPQMEHLPKKTMDPRTSARDRGTPTSMDITGWWLTYLSLGGCLIFLLVN